MKNKVAPPFRQAEFDILYNRGISVEGDLLDIGVECGVIEESGAWLSYEGERIGQGRENARKLLLDRKTGKRSAQRGVAERRRRRGPSPRRNRKTGKRSAQ